MSNLVERIDQISLMTGLGTLNSKGIQMVQTLLQECKEKIEPQEAETYQYRRCINSGWTVWTDCTKDEFFVYTQQCHRIPWEFRMLYSPRPTSDLNLEYTQ
jgi:hypothetical protein